jgi:hypothetical protein
MRATCHAHLILFDLIILRSSGEEYKWCSSSLCSFLQPLFSSWSPCVTFHNLTIFMVVCCLPPTKPSGWRTTSCRLSATAYSVYSQPHSAPSVIWGRAMPWWQRTHLAWGYCGLRPRISISICSYLPWRVAVLYNKIVFTPSYSTVLIVVFLSAPNRSQTKPSYRR